MTSRRRRTKAQVAQLEAQILKVCEADHPVSVRHVFYRMTDPRLAEPVPKTEQGYKQIQKRIVDMRRAGRLPYGWISDATRMGWHVPTYRDPAEFVRAQAQAYRFDVWGDSDTLVEVWCESRSIAGMIHGECERLAVSLYPCGGFALASYAWHAAQGYEEYDAVNVVYVGDYDPAGVLIDVALSRELRTHTSTRVTFDRVAVNQTQIRQFDLPTKPRKVTDKRCPELAETVEAEAMPAPVLRSLVRDAVERHLTPYALDYATLMDEQGQEFLAAFDLGGWGNKTDSVVPMPF